VMNTLADCVKAIQGMTGNVRNSQAMQDLQCVVDATQAHVQVNPHKFHKTTIPDIFHNMQWVLRVQAPPSDHIPHTNDNRWPTCSMHPQAPFPMVPTDIPTVTPISVPLVATAIEPRSKPTTLAAKSSKRKRHCKRQATWMRNTITPTSKTTHIRTWAQVVTAAAQVAPPFLNTHSRTQQPGVPPPIHQPGFATAVMKQQRHQCRLMQLTGCITRLENKVHQAMAAMDKDTGKLLNYRQLINIQK
jgi:hypothetical protein